MNTILFCGIIRRSIYLGRYLSDLNNSIINRADFTPPF